MVEDGLLTPIAIGDAMEAGVVVLQSVTDDTFDGRKVLKARFGVQREGTHSIVEMLYAADQGYWPLRMRRTSPENGSLLEEVDIKIGAFVHDAQTFYYPLQIERDLHDAAGGVPWHESVSVDSDSVRFNEPIFDETFLLQPAPGETIESHDMSEG